MKTISSDKLPPLLREIDNPPEKLFVKGELCPEQKYIAIVGSRKATSYGKKVTRHIAYELSGMGFCIVSGLALGIDTFAHEFALEAGGKTVAVLACGLDRIYPYENSKLAEKISKNGALISEYEKGAAPIKYRFLERNRLISGMSIATIVVEAGEKSGALITARHAVLQGREVFAVPGDIDRSESKGCALLLKEGAHPFVSVMDVLENLNIQSNIMTYIKKKNQNSLSEEEKEIFKLVAKGSETSFEEIMRFSNFHISKIQSIISILELRGLIERSSFGFYTRVTL
jgi:DNA processing protein